MTEEQRRQAAEHVLKQVFDELIRTWTVFPQPMHSAHEGWAVLYEEVDEMWDEVKSNSIAAARREAIQVAAMAIRFAVEAGR